MFCVYVHTYLVDKSFLRSYMREIERGLSLPINNPPAMPSPLPRELAAAAADAAAAAGEEEFRPSVAPGISGGGNDLQGAGDGLLRESMVCPVFAALPQEQQLQAFEPAPKGVRKFVLVSGRGAYLASR